MIENLVNFAFGGFSGGEIGNLLAKWESQGIFAYVLPFLLIFALVFAVVSRMHIFRENKGINVIIALVVALMALQFDFVPIFFSEVFPRLGIGFSVILVILLLVGFFVDPSSDGTWKVIMGIVAAIVAVVVLLNSAGAVGMDTGDWLAENWGTVVAIVVVLGLVAAVIFGGGKKEPATGVIRSH